VLAAVLVEQLHRLSLFGEAFRLSAEFLLDGVGLGDAFLANHGRFRGVDFLDSARLGFLDPDLGEAVLLGRDGVGLFDPGGREPFGSGFRLGAFRETDLGCCVAVGGLELGVGECDPLDGLVLLGLFLGRGGLDVLDEGFFRRGLGRDGGGLFGTLGFLDDLELFDALPLLDNGALDSDAFADNVLNSFSLDFESFLLVDALELDFTFAEHLFEPAVFQDALGLDAITRSRFLQATWTWRLLFSSAT